MSCTYRHTYKGKKVHDGDRTHRCPEPDCDWCVRGKAKRPFRRRARRIARYKQQLASAGNLRHTQS